MSEGEIKPKNLHRIDKIGYVWGSNKTKGLNRIDKIGYVWGSNKTKEPTQGFFGFIAPSDIADLVYPV
jgi:hypothetical protein